MFSRIFGKRKQDVSSVATLEKLTETLHMLEKREKVFQKKAAAELERAKEFTRAKNKRETSTMDQIDEETENMKQIQEALSAPFGAAADFDEDGLEAELEELEEIELENKLLQPTTTAPLPVPRGKQPARVPQKRTIYDEDELASLQAQLAL